MKWRPVLEGIAFLAGVAALVGGCLAVLGPEDHEDPESIAVRVLYGPPPGGELAQWGERGKTVLLTTYGSSSCPTVPTAIKADEQKGLITVTVSDDWDGACTADDSPYTTEIRVPEEMDLSRAVHLIVVDGEKDRRFTL